MVVFSFSQGNFRCNKRFFRGLKLLGLGLADFRKGNATCLITGDFIFLSKFHTKKLLKLSLEGTGQGEQQHKSNADNGPVFSLKKIHWAIIGKFPGFKVTCNKLKKML